MALPATERNRAAGRAIGRTGVHVLGSARALARLAGRLRHRLAAGAHVLDRSLHHRARRGRLVRALRGRQSPVPRGPPGVFRLHPDDGLGLFRVQARGALALGRSHRWTPCPRHLCGGIDPRPAHGGGSDHPVHRISFIRRRRGRDRRLEPRDSSPASEALVDEHARVPLHLRAPGVGRPRVHGAARPAAVQ